MTVNISGNPTHVTSEDGSQRLDFENGWPCLAACDFPRRGMTSPLRVVLVDRSDKHLPGRFVVWLHNREDGGYFSGHYHADLADAYCDFSEIIAREGLRHA